MAVLSLQLSEVQVAMGPALQADYLVSPGVLSAILSLSIMGALAAAAVTLAWQLAVQARLSRNRRCLRYVVGGEEFALDPLEDDGAYHLFLSQLKRVGS